MKKFREMKKNNKGFSLVELIVVIAIMVVLVAVLGSTILGYVDKSKYSKDIQALDSLKTAISTYVADPKCNYTDGKKYTLTELMETGDGKCDPNGVISSTLAEVFKITATDGKTHAAFNNASAAFKGVTSENVHIIINKGAVSILVKSLDTAYENYTVGSQTGMPS